MPESQPCPTCKRTDGRPVDDPNRCGICLTGLSFNGYPIHPRQAIDGKWVSPIVGHDGEVVQLPDGTWTSLLPESVFGTREHQIEQVQARRAVGEW